MITPRVDAVNNQLPYTLPVFPAPMTLCALPSSRGRARPLPPPPPPSLPPSLGCILLSIRELNKLKKKKKRRN